MSRGAAVRLEPIDYDLHGIVGIRLEDATPSDARAVARQLGPLRKPLEREPDVVIRFVDDLGLTSPLHYLGADEAAFADDAFLVLQSRRNTRSRTRIPMDRIGGRCEIACESGAPSVPLLIATINLTALAKGVVPLHASAFVYRGTGILVTGWSKGGKTEALLAFMARGAEYLGDEWIYLAAGAKEMYGIPQPLRLWDWHLEQFPQYRERVGRRNMIRLRAMRTALAMGEGVFGQAGTPALFDKFRSLAKRQTYVDIAPERLFGPCASLRGPIDRVFLVGSGAAPQVEVHPISATEIATCMAHSVHYEFQRLLSHYLMFRFAFPNARNERIETLAEDLRVALHGALGTVPAYSVSHPYPMSIAALFDAMNPLV